MEGRRPRHGSAQDARGGLISAKLFFEGTVFGPSFLFSVGQKCLSQRTRRHKEEEVLILTPSGCVQHPVATTGLELFAQIGKSELQVA